MLVSAALGRVAGQGLYGVAQAALYRFEALLYAAAASGEGYGEGAAGYDGDGAREEGTARVLERLDAHHLAEAGDDFVGYREEGLGRVVALREAGAAGREDEVYPRFGPRRDGGAYFVGVVGDDFFVLGDAAAA